MKKKRLLFLRSIALFFAFEILVSTLLPTISYALTSGPSAPEYSSFEPVDTTDMVNLLTGDFVYNTPLLEVPGPAGGYPLSLAYHAGIKPDQESSWVGLGWNLNAGAINRQVNGVPDDHFQAFSQRHDYFEIAERETFSTGVGYGGASVNLSISNDANEGMGVGFGMAYGASFGTDKLGVDFGVSGGTDGYGQHYGNIGISATAGILSANVSTGFNGTTTYANASVNASIGVASVGATTNFKDFNFQSSSFATGGSLTSKIKGAMLSKVGITMSQGNSNAGRVSSETSSFNWTVPTPWGVTFSAGYDYYRHWIEETSDLYSTGSLYGYKTTNFNPDDHFFDSYALLNPFETGEYEQKVNAEKSDGGSFVAYDGYQVNAQGLSGSMSPLILKNANIFRQNVKVENSDTEYEVEYKRTGTGIPKAEFRFRGDFSNKFTVDPLAKMLPGDHISFEDMNYNFELKGYDEVQNKLAGSRHIEWFTNEEINNGVAKGKGLIGASIGRSLSKYTNENSPENNLKDQIGAFMITNESGVTYHYTLPAYTYEEYLKSFEKGRGDDRFMERHNKEPYAYTWLLTGITGSDYVDRNGEGTLNDEDYGYWVKFEYGLWTSEFEWRNPAIGYHEDIKQNMQTYSSGKKELYYLNSVSTKTHIALFEKEIKADGKSVTSLGVGGFTPLTKQKNFVDNGNLTVRSVEYTQFPKSTLRLNNIYLIEKEKLESIVSIQELEANGREYDHNFSYGNPNLNTDFTIHTHNGESVLDKFDLDDAFEQGETSTLRERIENASVRAISFGYSYDLQDKAGNDGVPNSFDPNGLLYDDDPQLALADVKRGKLTLKSLAFKGKKAVQVVPSTHFSYSNNQGYERGKYDMWQYYKSDYSDNGNQNFDRAVSLESSENVNAWSLGHIKTSLGAEIEIELESDEYKNPELFKNFMLQVNDLEREEATGTVMVEFINDSDQLNNFFMNKSNVSLLTMLNLPYQIEVRSTYQNLLLSGSRMENYINKEIELDIVEKGINENGKFFIKTSNTELFDLLETKLLEFVESGTETRYSCPPGLDWQSFVPTCKDEQGNFIQPLSRIFETKTYKGYYKPFIVSGIVSLSGNFTSKGGGTRVKRIQFKNMQDTNEINYAYHDVNDHSLTSGSTSFEPAGLTDNVYLEEVSKIEKKEEYEDSFYAKFSELLRIAREIPPPGVFYEYVTVTSSYNNQKRPGKEVYHFQNFKEEMVKLTDNEIDVENLTKEYYIPKIEDVVCSGGELDEIQVQYRLSDDTNGSETKLCGWLLSYAQSEAYWKDGGTVSKKKIKANTIQDFTSLVGALKWHRVYDDQGNVIISEETNYLVDEFIDSQTGQFDWEGYRNAINTKFKDQGVIHEITNENRNVKIGDLNKNIRVFSRRESYPSIVVGSTSINHKTNISSSQENLEFDFYSGAPIKVVNSNSYGDRFMVKTVPAYTVPEYANMGIKVNAQDFNLAKNMLIQVAANYVYKIDENNNPIGVVSASANTWSDAVDVVGLQSGSVQGGIWRKHKNYVWTGEDGNLLEDGTYDPLHFEEYADWNSEPQNSNWFRNAEITLYDYFSHALEVKDVDDIYATTKMTNDYSRVIVSATNSKYNESFYTGFEDENESTPYLGGGFYKNQGADMLIDQSHTGRKSMRINANEENLFADVNTNSGEKYLASLWTSNTDVRIKVNNTIVNGKIKGSAKDWHLLEYEFDAPSNEFTVSVLGAQTAESIIDDFRIHPFDAAVQSFVYNEWGELEYLLNTNNIYTKYEYNSIGSLVASYLEPFELNKEEDILLGNSHLHYGLNNETKFEITVQYSGPGQVHIPENGKSTKYSNYSISFFGAGGCPSDQYYVEEVYVDGVALEIYNEKEFVSGSKINWTSGGINFTNLGSSHEVYLKFKSHQPAGTYISTVCEATGQVGENGVYCKTGFQVAKFHDGCGGSYYSDRLTSGHIYYDEGLNCTADVNCNDVIQADQ